MGLPRRTAGFTLIELMLVAAIMSIIFLAFRASFAKSIANKHAISAAAELVRFGRFARAESIGRQRAHLLYVAPGAGTRNGVPLGQIALLRGTSSHCDTENWATPFALCASPPPTGSDCVDFLDLSSASWYHDPHEIMVRAVAPGQENVAGTFLVPGLSVAGVRSLCYEPQGNVYWSTNALGPAMQFDSHGVGAAAGGGFTWVLGLPTYVPVVLSFPLGGAPRRLR
jgi:prepilin-type N-terminal cleavage/methylation domain-containing protein